MAHKAFEADDPLELIGVEVRGPFATESDCLEEMARTFVDEYARIGWNREQLSTLFRDPFYQGPHAIYQARGEAFVQQLIAERVPEYRRPAPVDGECPGSLVCDAYPAPMVQSLTCGTDTVASVELSSHGPEEPRHWCGACPVGRSFGKVNCPIKRTARGVIAWIRTWLFRRLPHA